MLSKDPIRIAGPLGRIYSFTRHYQGDDFFEGPRLAFHHDRAYARDHLLRLTRSVVDDPFNYRLLDVWQLVFQKPWTRPRDVNQLIADLTDKIHRGELFVYLEPDLERDIPSLLRDGPPEGDGGFVDIGVLGRGHAADTPRAQDPVIITGNDGPQEDAPLTYAVPQGEPEVLKSNLNRWQLHRTVGLDTVVANGAGGETLGAMYDKVYDHEGNPLPGVDLDAAQAFDEAYLQAQDIREMRAEGYRMVAEDAALGMVLGPAGGLGSRLAGPVVKDIGRKLPFKDADRLTEVNKTLDRIETGGPFPYKKDGTVFKNKEGKLPEGNYREYTVDTPGGSNRGARRVVQDVDTGKAYYTDDHYKNFIQIDPAKR